MTLISYYPQLFHYNTEKEIIIVDKSNIKLVKLNIKGMTCTGCEENINHTLNQLDGIIEINTSFQKGTSEIKFDKSKTNTSQIENAIKSKGYQIKSTNIE